MQDKFGMSDKIKIELRRPDGELKEKREDKDDKRPRISQQHGDEGAVSRPTIQS